MRYIYLSCSNVDIDKCFVSGLSNPKNRDNPKPPVNTNKGGFPQTNKRPRTSPPSPSHINDRKAVHGSVKSSAFQGRNDVIDHASDESKFTSTGKSGLPERLKNRIYPSRSTESRLQNIRSSEQTADKPVQNPFQSAKSKYAADCIRQGKEVDPSIKKSLGGKSVHSTVSLIKLPTDLTINQQPSYNCFKVFLLI